MMNRMHGSTFSGKVKSDADVSRMLDNYQFKHYFKRLRGSKMLFEFFQRGISQQDVFQINVDLNFFYKKVSGHALYGNVKEIEQAQMRYLAEEVLRSGLSLEEIEKKLEVSIAYMDEVQRQRDKEKLKEQADLKKGDLTDNKVWIFDSNGRPINLRDRYRKETVVKNKKAASTMPRFDPNKTCRVTASKVTKSITVPPAKWPVVADDRVKGRRPVDENTRPVKQSWMRMSTEHGEPLALV